ncbi:MAG TPA: DinB family protein [Terriglobales bacterium]|nr:DinB family protein [Terriglobales bacterium]
MKSYKTIVVLVSICCVFGIFAFAQAGSSGSTSSAQSSTAPPTMTSVLNSQLRGIEREIMNAADAIPQDKFDFSPGTSNIPGDFKTPSPVRTLAEQFKHIGDALEGEAAGIMGQKLQPSPDENGPKNVKTKQEVIDYLKAAFAKAHSAIDTINQQNATEEIANPFGGNRKTTRLSLAVGMVGHSNNHYGQIIEYLRMNSIVPPESRRSGS